MEVSLMKASKFAVLILAILASAATATASEATALGADGAVRMGAVGMADPSCVYCEALGYRCEDGNCTFPDGTSVPTWEFYRGRAGRNFSFCELQGYRVENRTENVGNMTAEYAVCVYDDCSECSEQRYFSGECGPSNCSSWSMTDGCTPPIEFEGLISKTARINNSAGTTAGDVLGWDVVYRGEDGVCRSYYVAEAPLIGMTRTAEVDCPAGLRPFDRYMVGYEEAIAAMKSIDCGGVFVNLTLSWPDDPQVAEPQWRMTTDIGNEIVVGANCGLGGCRSVE